MDRANDSDVRRTTTSDGLTRGLITLILLGIAAVLVIRAVRPGSDPHPIALPPLEVAGWLNTAGPLTNDELRGRVVLVDCWASWCIPCVEKMPQLVRFHERYRDRGLTLIGLTPESGGEVTDLTSYVESVRGLDWPIGYGAQLPFEIMDVSTIPTFVLFDKSGRSVWSGHGLAGLEDAVIALLAEGG